ncbi:MAG: hypothetical protein RMJ43_09150 [Chloroherpetonaceae bacterium]|nr:hypothetical protein [Chloroherpetonaceae bacterium]
MESAMVSNSPEVVDEEQLAERYLGGLVYRVLIEAGEPLRLSEVVARMGRLAGPEVDARLVRVILATHPGVTSVDRKWTLWTRYLDTQRTVDHNLHQILGAYGQPMRIAHLAQEMQTLYGRPAEVYATMLTRLADAGDRYFRVGEDGIAPTEWLLITEYEDDDEVMFDNFLEDEAVLPLIPLAEEAGLSPQRPEAVVAFLDAVGRPVSPRVVQFLAWRADREGFRAATFYAAAFQQQGVSVLTDGTWVGPAVVARLARFFPILAEREVSEPAEVDTQEASQPLTIGDAEREQLVERVCASDGTVFAERLLEEVFEVMPGARTYAEDLQAVMRVLQEDPRVLWVGGSRFRPQGTVPAYVLKVPELLEIPNYQYADLEGNPLDYLLEDEGLDGALSREILDPRVQDVLDEEPVGAPDPNPPSNVRVVIKYHHKQLGTLPLCQFPAGFFPVEPVVLETEFVLPGGQRVQVWVNNQTRLLYGLLDWFETIPINSGATFTLERQAPDRYVVNYNNESEPAMFISDNRIQELLKLQERAEQDGLSTFDIMRAIMEHSRKGIEFVTLHTEVNVVRRVARRLVASNLSAYHCFFLRGGAWVYDAKKLSQGFDKSKRKYLIR